MSKQGLEQDFSLAVQSARNVEELIRVIEENKENPYIKNQRGYPLNKDNLIIKAMESLSKEPVFLAALNGGVPMSILSISLARVTKEYGIQDKFVELLIKQLELTSKSRANPADPTTLMVQKIKNTFNFTSDDTEDWAKSLVEKLDKVSTSNSSPEQKKAQLQKLLTDVYKELNESSNGSAKTIGSANTIKSILAEIIKIPLPELASLPSMQQPAVPHTATQDHRAVQKTTSYESLSRHKPNPDKDKGEKGPVIGANRVKSPKTK